MNPNIVSEPKINQTELTALPLTPVQLEIERKIGISRASLSTQILQQWQLARLNQVLQYVKKRSPFYQNLFASFPEHLDSFTEFEKYPFTTADDIAKEGNRMICVSQSEIARIVTLDTSGTTGKPKRIFFTREDQELTIDFFGVGMSTLIEPGYKVLILLPGNTPGSVGDLLQKGIERVGSIGIQHGPFTDPYATNTRIEALRIQTLVGTPKQVFTLARVWQIAGMKNCPVRSILLSTDYAAPSLMNRIRETWNCSILQHYGMTEAGLGVGIDCAAARGFHLREADLYFELIDSNGLPVPDGTPGEVVLTTLTRKGMPLIRYRSKDISRVIQGDCPCGTVQKTYEWIKKRKDDDPSIISIQQLDDLIFDQSGINGFNAAWIGKDLKLNLYWESESHFKNASIIDRMIRDQHPLITHIIIQNEIGFPDSAFEMRKKRIAS